ncbi:hypothetical protein JXA32_02390 [Candidatus Sumerlaeota bacterium]|nr:hypothetical protein [Candidatus Sumerlaeota bacterium]
MAEQETENFPPINVDISGWLNRAMETFKVNMGEYIIAALIFLAVTFVTCGGLLGILSGPLLMGFLYFLRKKMRDEETTYGDLFWGFSNHFVDTLLVGLIITFGGILIMTITGFILSIIPILGTLVSIALNIVIGGVMMFIMTVALCGIQDGKTQSVDAITFAYNHLLRDIQNLGLYSCINSLIGNLGFCVCLVGSLFTIPFIYIAMITMYEGLIGEEGSTPDGGGGSPGSDAPAGESKTAEYVPQAFINDAETRMFDANEQQDDSKDNA